MMLTLQLADLAGLRWAQEQVQAHHYLHCCVDARCSPMAYLALLDGRRAGCLIFGRPEATRVNGWFGSVEDVKAGRCPLTRWQVLNMARVWLDPVVQRNGASYIANAATWIIAQALRRVGYEYLTQHPPCFLDEPFEIREILSYCDSSTHRGTLYRAANFRLVRENERGIQTYARPLRHLTHAERAAIEKLARDSYRSIRYRAMRAVAHYQQASLALEIM